MPDAIGANRSPDPNLTRYYDAEAGLCSTSAQQSVGNSTSTSDRSSTLQGELGPHAPGVARLLADQAARGREQASSLSELEDCAIKVGKAALTCTTAALAAVVGSATGPLDLAIVGVAGAGCAFDVADTYECVTNSR